jgi:hypothetical protein
VLILRGSPSLQLEVVYVHLRRNELAIKEEGIKILKYLLFPT